MINDLNNYGLEPLWRVLLEIYKAYRAICDRHNLRHWAAFGTALGAARHQGFIPWDDDFDVMMPRSDYEKFLEIATKELPDYLKVVNWRNTDGYQWLFGKIQDVRKDQLNRLETEMGRVLPQGIYIDIFPCDGYPEKAMDVLRHKLGRFLLCARREYCVCPKHKRRRLRRRIMIALGSFLRRKYNWISTLREFVGYNENLIRKYDYETSPYVIINETRFSLGLTGSVFPKGVFLSGTVEMPFDNMTIPVLADWERYLEIVFGDWRKLPPEHMRHATHENEEMASWR